MLLPTIATFEQLRGRSDRTAIEAAFRPGADLGPPVVGGHGDGLATVDQRWAGGIAGRSEPAWLVGRREVVLVDAADPTGETMAAIDTVLAERGARIVGLALTGIAPAQAAGAELYAAGRGLPVVGGAGGATPYPRIFLAPGDAIPFGDVRVEADAPDGRAAGSLAYRLPDERRLPPRLAGRGSERRED